MKRNRGHKRFSLNPVPRKSPAQAAQVIHREIATHTWEPEALSGCGERFTDRLEGIG
ncbi:hypothetical protein FB561_6556 [Kribbella amoyensis]|uniref:Uncharacterized protein n=1 Tax=Kribbella amoyensis TaxID=996641 RepID=A0A561B8N4_9ACTN|nr:hypothetical protein FB561_6556 [Kribbella amoyensis]